MSDIDGHITHGGQGGLEAANRTSREMATWEASPLPMNVLMRFDKDTVDDRARDVVLNDGYASGAMAIHKDNIVGSQYRLNARPDCTALGINDPEWEERFQNIVEARFNGSGDSIRNWFDAQGKKDFTSIIRLAVGMYMVYGELIGVMEWVDTPNRPFHTAIQLINPRRLCNPHGTGDTDKIEAGIERDQYGRAVAYHIMKAHPYDFTQPENAYQWQRIAAETPWGRPQVVHIMEQLLSEQTRGVSEMVAVLKQMRMTRRFQDVELQQAILQATYAATLESDLPASILAEVMGSNPNAPSFEDSALRFLGSVAKHRSTRDLRLDGVKIPVLHPNTKLNLKQLGQPSGTGSEYEQSLLRHVAAGLGLSYEQFSRDYTKTNYSSSRASMNETYKFMQSRKKTCADRVATNIYRCWLEEQIQAGTVPLPKGKRRDWIYSDPFIMDALSRCSWIGAARGQIDEMKETQSAILRINAGLSTLEEEAARLGRDWRELLAQRAREQRVVGEYGLTLSDGAEKPVVNKKATEDKEGSVGETDTSEQDSTKQDDTNE